MTVNTPIRLRADARRNREKVLAAAETLLVRDGLATTLDEIARHAGVGAGTIYRHFPTKEALIHAVVDRRVDQINEEAQRALDVPDPALAFFGLLAHTMDHASVNMALCDVFASPDDWWSGVRSDVECDFRETLGTLLRRAQSARVVRTGVTAADVDGLVLAYVAMAKFNDTDDGRRRAARLLWRALVRDNSLVASLPVPGERPLGIRRTIETKRNETSPRATKRNETAPSISGAPHRCPSCGGPIEPAATGRPAKYCSAACRLRAHRARTTSHS